MADKKEPQADPLEQIKAADAEARESEAAIHAGQVAEAMDTDAEVRESQLRMSAAMGKEMERHEKVLAAAEEKKRKALESLDRETYWARVWGRGERQIIVYQCGYCPTDDQSEDAIKQHQTEAHLTDIRDAGPLTRDRDGVLIEQKEG